MAERKLRIDRVMLWCFMGLLVFGLLLGIIHNKSAPAPADAPATGPDITPAPPAATKAPQPDTPAAPPVQTEDEKPDPYAIYYLATDSVKKQLKAPDSAKFSSLGFDQEAMAVPYGYRQWLCSGFVDSQNSFGATVREKWGAYVFQSPAATRVDYMEIGAETFGQLPSQIPFPPSVEERHRLESAQAASELKDIEAASAGQAKALALDLSLAGTNDADGLFRMGRRYLHGDGVAKDAAKARDYFGRAAAAGNETAKAELASMPGN